MKNKYIIAFVAFMLSVTSCTKLDEDLHGQIGNQGVTVEIIRIQKRALD